MRSRHLHTHRGEHAHRTEQRGIRPQPVWPDLSLQGREEGRRGGRDGHHGGGRRHRLFDHGELRFLLLHLIAEKPRHGYEVIKAIEDRAGGGYSPSPGAIYPTLTMLEELGYTTLSEQDGRKLHTLTEAGAAFLRENQRSVDAITARIAEAAAARGDGPDPQLIRAVENLKLALRLRLSRGSLTEAETRAVAAALDAAATAVEQA